MNEGVKILIERMKTNPEEFVGEVPTSSKWGGLIMQYRDCLNEEDKKALNHALNKLTQQRFTEEVMKELLAPEEDDSLGKQWYTKQTAMPLIGETQEESTKRAFQVEQMKLHLDAHRHAMKAEEERQRGTLFGRLKNYLHTDE